MGSDEGENEFAKERESESRTAVLIGRRTEREGEERRGGKKNRARQTGRVGAGIECANNSWIALNRSCGCGK